MLKAHSHASCGNCPAIADTSDSALRSCSAPGGILLIQSAAPCASLAAQAEATAATAPARCSPVGSDDAQPMACSGDCCAHARAMARASHRSEEHTSELQSHSFISYAVFC